MPGTNSALVQSVITLEKYDVFVRNKIFFVPINQFDNLDIFHFILVIDNSIEVEKYAVDVNRELWT